jgi:hypothetical protein
MTTPLGGAAMYGDQVDLELVEEAAADALPFQELGVTGLKRSAGYLDEEFLPQLKGKKAIQVYREMSDNDPIVGALLFAIDKLVRNADWQVTPAGKTKEHTDAAKLVETCMEDMSHSWDDMISEVLSMLIYGWSYHEIVYKRRMGPWQRDGRQRSKYADGLVGWRKIPIRSQETLHRWAFDESGGVRGMIQMGPPDYSQRVLPIERSLLFRYHQHKGSPEGRSMLRNAYRPWFYKKRLEEFEAIGVERDLAGLPMIRVPAEWLKAKPGSPQHKQVEAFKRLVRGLRRNEQEGLVFPRSIDADTKQDLFDFELLGGGSQRSMPPAPIIERYENRILMTVLADFIMVGHQRVGSYNLHLDKTGIFRTALNATCQNIADVFNRHAIPRLFAVNGWKPAELPKLTVTDVDAPDITQLAQFLTATAGLGFNWGPDEQLEKYLRHAAGLPPMEDDQEKKTKRHARVVESTRFAQAQTEYLAARSMLAQQKATEMQMEAGMGTPEEQASAFEQQQAMQQGEQQAVQAGNEERRTEEAHQMSIAAQAQQLQQGAAAKPTTKSPAGKR